MSNDGNPELRLDTISKLCSMRMRPQVMTAFMTELFRWHFADPNNIEDSSLRDVIWRKDVEERRIGIMPISKYDPQNVERRPSIVIRRNGWRVVRLGIDDRLMGLINMDGFERYTTFMQGSHTLFCLAGEGAEAEILAAEVFRNLIQFGPLLRRNLDLMRFAVVDVGQLHEIEESSENFAVPVTVAYAHQDTWMLRQSSPRLKKFSLQASALMEC
jgi:hypothetical protein